MSGPHFTSILWDREDDPGGNVQHIARHKLTMDEVEAVFENPTGTGRYIMVAYEVIDATTAYPITAYDVPRPKRR